MPAEFQSLKDWRAGFKSVTLEEAGEELGMDRMEFSSNCKAVRLMPCGMYIEDVGDGWFWTIVERSDLLGNWDKVSAWAYFEWASTEMIPPATTDDMAQLLGDWCDWKGIPSASVDEMLVDLRCFQGCGEFEAKARRLWMEWFIQRWEKLQDAEDAAAREVTA